MKTITFPLKPNMKRADMDDLHQALVTLGYSIADTEKTSQRFGASTRAAVLDFQKKHQLEPTGIVDERTAGLISAQAGLRQMVIKGKVSDQNGNLQPGLAVKAFDRNVGEADTLLT